MADVSSPEFRGFNVLVKPIGSLCNLRCRYCFYLEKEALYPENRLQSDWILQEDMLEEFIRRYIASQPGSDVSFAWQGGEPTLLGVDYFRKVVAFQNKYANGRKIENSLQTNGVLLDDAWCAFLAENHFLVGLSLDGPAPLHDRGRVDKGGAPSFDRVLRSVECLKKHGVEFNTLTVVHRHNSRDPLKVYRFLKEIGHGFLQFIPIVERAAVHPGTGEQVLVPADFRGPAQVTEWSVEPLRYGRFLSAIFDEWVRNDVGKIFVQLFDVTLASWVGMEPALCVFQRTCGKAPVLEHNGDLYSCDHYVYPENRIGNIMEAPLAEIVNSDRQVRFGREKQDRLPQYCRECPILFACNGECPKHRFITTTAGETDLNYLCPAYKHFFTHVTPFMDFMAAELKAARPPANVMAWVRRKDAGVFDGKRPGRNDPCPCGSGLKYKRCCGRT
ncbi:MAG: anaerobic sulfatase-maturation protein [Acidobacteria bacterium]|nr:anaerobic sulfatase-maturation protein [Acidobacteriota bacterium]